MPPPGEVTSGLKGLRDGDPRVINPGVVPGERLLRPPTGALLENIEC